MKLLIGVPTVDMVNNVFAECLANLTKRLALDGVDFDLFVKRRTVVHVAREAIAQKAAEEGYTHVLWLDSDMVFEPDVFEKLYGVMKDTKAAIVSCVYRNRHGKMGICLWSSLKPNTVVEELPKETVFRIEGCGFGCVLTTVDIIKRIRYDIAACFHPTVEYGEDLAFCARAKKAGAKAVATQDVMCGHIGNMMIGADGETKPL